MHHQTMQQKGKTILLLLHLFWQYSRFYLLANAAEVSLIGVEIFEMDLMSDGNGEVYYNLNNHPLKDKHLIIIPSAFDPFLLLTKNASGYIVNVTGPSVNLLEHLSELLHFTFEYYQDYNQLPQFLEDVSTEKPGKISFFCRNNEIDIITGGFGLTEKRNQVINYGYPTTINPMALMIPKPKSQQMNYLVIIWEPFQPQVWLYLVMSMVVGMVSLYGIARVLARINHKKIRDDGHNQRGVASDNIKEGLRFEKSFKFIFGIIVAQGSAAGQALGNSKKLALRFLSGTWCLACFVLITAFSSVLVSFLTASETYKPIINTVNDLPKRDVQVTVTKELFADIIFRNAVNDDKAAIILKYLGNELKHHPGNRCLKTEQCVNQVRKGSSVYISNDNIVRHIIEEDWKNTGKCDFTVAKETFLMVLSSGYLLKKNSPFTEYMNRGLMDIQAFGLIDYWFNKNATDFCLKKIERETNNKKTRAKKPLTLKSLSGAFIVLGIGYVLALLAFVSEICHSRITNNRRRRQNLIRSYNISSFIENAEIASHE